MMQHDDESNKSNSVSNDETKTSPSTPVSPKAASPTSPPAATSVKTPARSPKQPVLTEESYKTPVRESKKRSPEISSAYKTPKHRKTDIGPSRWFRSPDSVQYNLIDPVTPEFVSPTRRRRFLVPRLDPKALDQLAAEMTGIEAPKHVKELIPKSLIMNKNCVEAAFDWLLDHWEATEESVGLQGEGLEQLYSTDQDELRKSSSFTEFEIDITGELTVTRVVMEN
eukprot:g845.t1